MQMAEQRSYVVVAVGLAVGGLIAMLLARKRVRNLLRGRAMRGVEFVKEPASRLRATAEEIAKRAREFVGPLLQPVKTDAEAEKQAYEKERREILGG
jgi:hypothetical protein